MGSLGARMLCTQFQDSWKQHYISSGLLAPSLACDMTGHLLLSLFLLGLCLLCCPPCWPLFLWELEFGQGIPHIILWNSVCPLSGTEADVWSITIVLNVSFHLRCPHCKTWSWRQRVFLSDSHWEAALWDRGWNSGSWWSASSGGPHVVQS